MFIEYFNAFSDVVFKMTWLNDLAGFIVENLFKQDISTPLGASLQFFIFDTIKIFILLVTLIYTISYIQSYFPPERTQKILGNIKGFKGRVIGALLGTITPFCSCSSIPIFIGFTASGLPVGTTLSFLISSPLVDLASFLMLMSFFGFKIAFIYVLVGLVLAIIGGTIIDKLGMEDQVQEYVREMTVGQQEQLEMTRANRHSFASSQVKDIARKVWPYVLAGVAIGAVIHNYVPESIITNILGAGNIFGVPVATIVGIPVYADIFGILPIAEALFVKGAQIGTLLAFMMSVTALSLPSLIMLSKVIKPKLLITFTVIVAIGIIIIGYSFNAFGHLFM